MSLGFERNHAEMLEAIPYSDGRYAFIFKRLLSIHATGGNGDLFVEYLHFHQKRRYTFIEKEIRFRKERRYFFVVQKMPFDKEEQYS